MVFNRNWVLRLVPAIGVLLTIALGMAAAIPMYDDTLLDIMLAEHGPRSLYQMHPDAPLAGWVYWKLAGSGLLWAVGIVANVLSWAAIGWATHRLYFELLGETASPLLAQTAALLAMSPILVDTHFVVWTTGMAILGCVAMAYLALALVASERGRLGWRTWVAGALSALANVMYFYAVPVAVASVVLLVGRRFLFRARSGARDIARAVVLAGSGGAAFLVYYLSSSFQWRAGSGAVANVSVSNALANFFDRAVHMPANLISGLWLASGGAVARELARVSLRGLPAIFGVGAGIMFAGAVWWATRRDSRADASTENASARRLLAIATVAVAAFVPVLLMGRTLTDETMVSRYFIPALPLATVLCVALLEKLLAREYRRELALALVFLCGFTVVSKAVEEHRKATWMRSIGAVVRQHLDPNGYTVAYVVPNAPWVTERGDDAFTARLVQGWSLSERQRFWAVGTYGPFGPQGTSRLRGAARPECVDKLLLVEIVEDDKIRLADLRPPPCTDDGKAAGVSR